jgi:hypothetical protein
MARDPQMTKKIQEHRAKLTEDQRRLEALEAIADSLRQIESILTDIARVAGSRPRS